MSGRDSAWKGLAATAQSCAWRAFCECSFTYPQPWHGCGEGTWWTRERDETQSGFQIQTSIWKLFVPPHPTISFRSKTGHPHHTAWWPDPAVWNEEDRRLFSLCNWAFCTRSSAYKERIWAPENLLQFLFVRVVWEVKGKSRGHPQAGTIVSLNLFFR